MNKIKEYIKNSPVDKQDKLIELYEFLKTLMPSAVSEDIKWAMPTFIFHGNLVHFAYGKHHVGFYPGASGVECVVDELKQLGLKYSKGAIQFPLNKPYPFDLIRKIVEFRIKENQAD